MAKLRPEQLDQALKKGLDSIYILSGDEPLLIQEAADSIRAQARKQGFSERELFHVDNQFDWGQLLSAANALSLFAEKKILELRMPSGKPGDKGAKILQDYVESPSPDNLLLIITNKIDGATQKTKWFKALESRASWVQVWPVPPAQLPRFISQRLTTAGLKAEPDAIALLASRIEGNLLAAIQEIEKLKLIASDQIITTEFMASAVADSARYDVFGLADKALAGDKVGAVKMLQGLRNEGTDAITILWALAREIRALIQVADAINQGQAFEAAARQSGIWDKRQPLFQQAIRRLRPNQLQQLLRKANGVDKAIKGMRNAEPWDELLDIILNLSGVQSLHPANEKLNLKL
ncbi:MAG: DNA polymerase III subunit delta [Cellvibrio sp.]